eukprot:5356100-Alexandrium_andersonii.AAC.1
MFFARTQTGIQDKTLHPQFLLCPGGPPGGGTWHWVCTARLCIHLQSRWLQIECVRRCHNLPRGQLVGVAYAGLGRTRRSGQHSIRACASTSV